MNRWLSRLEPWLSRNRSWLARSILVVGAVLVAAQVLPSFIASRQVVSFDFGKHPSRVTQLKFTWKREGDEPVQGGATLTPPADHPKPISHSIRVPDGLYRFDLRVERTDEHGRRTRTDYVRRVALDGHPTKLLLHPQP